MNAQLICAGVLSLCLAPVQCSALREMSTSPSGATFYYICSPELTALRQSHPDGPPGEGQTPLPSRNTRQTLPLAKMMDWGVELLVLSEHRGSRGSHGGCGEV